MHVSIIWLILGMQTEGVFWLHIGAQIITCAIVEESVGIGKKNSSTTDTPRFAMQLRGLLGYGRKYFQS